jgi:mannose-6-phosphate isomerase-like protein (cupin superfamily)
MGRDMRTQRSGDPNLASPIRVTFAIEAGQGLMQILDIATTPTKIVTPHGETIYELTGKAVVPQAANHSVAHVVITPQGTSLRHFHRRTEESYYIMSGEAFVEIGDESATLRAGQIVLIPPTMPHKVYNTGDHDLVMLVSCAPAWEASDVVWLETFGT